MIPGHAYLAMLVTGSLHFVLGVATLITSIVGLRYAIVDSTYHGVVILPGTWICLVGGLGIATGIQTLADETIRQLKIAYMVTAILSAAVMSLIGWGMYLNILVEDTVVTLFTGEKVDLTKVLNIAKFGVTFISLEFVLAIVSSSLCCCCSPTTPVCGVVIQQPPTQIITTVPGNSVIMYQQQSNTSIPYQPFQNDPVNYQPPPYQRNSDPTQSK